MNINEIRTKGAVMMLSSLICYAYLVGLLHTPPQVNLSNQATKNKTLVVNAVRTISNYLYSCKFCNQ